MTIQIVIVVAMLTVFTVIAAARKARKRRFPQGKYIKGNVDELLALGTLAGRTLVGQVFDESLSEPGRISSIVATWSQQGFTAAVDDGPIMVGYAHSDYSGAEIEAVIENTGSWDLGDKVAQEIGKRLIRIVGVFRTTGPGGSSFDATVLNKGLPIKTKLNWQLNTGDTLTVWGYNLGSSALATTDPQINVEGHANIWQKA